MAAIETPEGYTGGDALIETLHSLGLDTAFGVPGESYLAALDAMARRGTRFVACRHEAAAANMTEAAGKLTGRPGVCFVTRGPGTAHAAIGLHTAFQDSTPMILFIGQVAGDQRDREAFQEIDYRRFLSEVTKWTAEIHHSDRIAEYVSRAYHTAVSGRPGPVALALPEDMLAGPAKRQPIKPFRPATPAPSPDQVADVRARLEGAQRPLFMVGGPGWTDDICTRFRQHVERVGLSVAASFRAQDRLDNDSPCYIGDFGIVANPALEQRLTDCDLLIALGPRLGEMTTGGYRRLVPPVADTPLVHVHPGAEELGRVYQPDIAICSLPGPFIDALFTGGLKVNPAWQNGTGLARKAYQNWQAAVPNPGAVQLCTVYETLNTVLPADTILANGAGNYAAWLHRFKRYHGYGTQLAPTSGAMGYGLPASLAAKHLYPDRTVVAFAGDGCFMMSAADLATAVQYELGVLVLVFNNSLYGTIRMHQAKTYPGRPFGTSLVNPDFAALAQSFGAWGQAVQTQTDFQTVLEDALKATRRGQPALIEIPVHPDAIAPGRSLRDLEPNAH